MRLHGQVRGVTLRHSPQNWALFLEHRHQTWFIEKYGVDEAMQQLRLHATRQGRVPAVQKYLDELEKGTWDEVNYDASRMSARIIKRADAHACLSQPTRRKCEKQRTVKKLMGSEALFRP